MTPCATQHCPHPGTVEVEVTASTSRPSGEQETTVTVLLCQDCADEYQLPQAGVSAVGVM